MTAPATPISPLVADIITASMSMTHQVADRLVDTLTAQLADAHAREKAVECGIVSLLSGPYMPTPAAIERALYPDVATIDQFREDTSR